MYLKASELLPGVGFLPAKDIETQLRMKSEILSEGSWQNPFTSPYLHSLLKKIERRIINHFQSQGIHEAGVIRPYFTLSELKGLFLNWAKEGGPPVQFSSFLEWSPGHIEPLTCVWVYESEKIGENGEKSQKEVFLNRLNDNLKGLGLLGFLDRDTRENPTLYMENEKGSHRYLYCEKCHSESLLSNASLGFPSPDSQIECRPSRVSETLPVENAWDLSRSLNLNPKRILRVEFFEAVGREKPLALLIRGDLHFNFYKIRNHLGITSLSRIPEQVVRRKMNCEAAFFGPIGLYDFDVFADLSVKPMKNFVTGLNQGELVLLDANYGRDFPTPPFENLHQAVADEPCPHCHSPWVPCLGEKVGGSEFQFENKKGFHFFPLKMAKSHLSQARVRGKGQISNELRPFEGVIFPLAVEGASGELSKELATHLGKKGRTFLLDDRNLPLSIKISQSQELGFYPCLLVESKNGKGRIGLMKTPDSRTLYYDFDRFIDYFKGNQGSIPETKKPVLELAS